MVKPEDRFDHMPHTQPYPVEDVLFDLLEVRLKASTQGIDSVDCAGWLLCFHVD